MNHADLMKWARMSAACHIMAGLILVIQIIILSMGDQKTPMSILSININLSWIFLMVVAIQLVASRPLVVGPIGFFGLIIIYTSTYFWKTVERFMDDVILYLVGWLAIAVACLLALIPSPSIPRMRPGTLLMASGLLLGTFTQFAMFLDSYSKFLMILWSILVLVGCSWNAKSLLSYQAQQWAS